jgi:hypothetical protein
MLSAPTCSPICSMRASRPACGQISVSPLAIRSVVVVASLATGSARPSPRIPAALAAWMRSRNRWRLLRRKCRRTLSRRSGLPASPPFLTRLVARPGCHFFGPSSLPDGLNSHRKLHLICPRNVRTGFSTSSSRARAQSIFAQPEAHPLFDIPCHNAKFHGRFFL